MNLLTRMLLVTAALSAAACADTMPVVTFQLDPIDGFLQGAAGSSVGWGFTLSTDSGFVVIETIFFQESSPIGVATAFVPGAVASAGSPISAPWALNTLGIQYDIDSAAILNAATSGPMTVIYDAYSDAGLTDQIVFGQFLNAADNGVDTNAEVFVNAASTSTVPEPSTMLLLATGAAAALARHARRRFKLADADRNGPLTGDHDAGRG